MKTFNLLASARWLHQVQTWLHIREHFRGFDHTEPCSETLFAVHNAGNTAPLCGPAAVSPFPCPQRSTDVENCFPRLPPLLRKLRKRVTGYTRVRHIKVFGGNLL